MVESCFDRDIESLVEKGEDIAFALKRTDDSFYGVVFASKGSSMLIKIYAEAKAAVDKSVREFDEVLDLLRAANCPGV